ncbi:MAG TPA: hypothetical protein VMG30_17590 [Acidobacteriota bacterium]|nr:hypothetical protein [Acidobacteriota bacterium]
MYRANGCMELESVEKNKRNLPIRPMPAQKFPDQITVRLKAGKGPLFGQTIENSLKLFIHWAACGY